MIVTDDVLRAITSFHTVPCIAFGQMLHDFLRAFVELFPPWLLPDLKRRYGVKRVEASVLVDCTT